MYHKAPKPNFPPGLPEPKGIVRESDGAHIPADPLNADWQAYQAWLTAGNAPAEPEGPDLAPAAEPAKT